MLCFQFTVDNNSILSLIELKEELYLISNPIVENTEGIYKHGKVNADNKFDAECLIKSTVLADVATLEEEDWDYENTISGD